MGLLVSSVLLAGCDDTTEPEQFNPVGSVTFTYEGEISGSYSAAGTLDPDGTTLPTGGATGLLDDTTMMVVSLRMADATHADDRLAVMPIRIRRGGDAAR